MFVNHSTIARWESGSRLPDAAMILRLSKCLEADANTLFQLAARSDDSPNVILVDDSKAILNDGRGFDVGADSEPGVALQNIRQRLELMCGGSLTITPNEGGGTVVTLTVPDNYEQ